MIPKGPGILGNLQLKEFEQTSSLLQMFPSDINADENGAYLKSRNTNKCYSCDNDRTSIFREDISGKSYHNERLSRNSY